MSYFTFFYFNFSTLNSNQIQFSIFVIQSIFNFNQNQIYFIIFLIIFFIIISLNFWISRFIFLYFNFLILNSNQIQIVFTSNLITIFHLTFLKSNHSILNYKKNQITNSNFLISQFRFIFIISLINEIVMFYIFKQINIQIYILIINQIVKKFRITFFTFSNIL